LAAFYGGQAGVDGVLASEDRGLANGRRVARELAREQFDLAILFQNAFRAALLAWWAGIPRRAGYRTDARGFLLTDAVRVPRAGEIPPHQSFYYLESLRRLGLLETLPAAPEVRLTADRAAEKRVERLLSQVLAKPAQRPRIAVVPGAAFGSAKRWLPERFAALAERLVERSGAAVLVCGTAEESFLGEEIRQRLPARGWPVVSLMGLTSLEELVALLASCDLVIGNDSGVAHLAAAVGVPQITIFGPTNPDRTRAMSSRNWIVQKRVSCSPCELRECPVDHRCMRGIGVEDVWEAVEAALASGPGKPRRRFSARAAQV
jgi:heptosyltransferase-2